MDKLVIGDYLDLDAEATYPCSDGSVVSTVSVDKLLNAQREETEKETRWEVGGELCCLIGNKMLKDMEAGKLLGDQAEISFKAGYKEALEGAVMKGGFESVKKLGIKEVVEYVQTHSYMDDYGNTILLLEENWQVRLKEWGF